MASAARNVAARSIHIKIHPTARSLSERREVLRVLQRFGQVEMFRSLKYDPTSPVSNAFLSILSTEEAAQAALEASPIRYRLITGPVSAPSTPSSPPAPSTPSSPPAPSTPSSPPAPSPADDTPQLDTFASSPFPPSTSPTAQFSEESIFELRISPSAHPHQKTITSSPLHSTYTPISVHRSPFASDLSQRIPPSIAKAGLVDWVTDSTAARASSGERGSGTRFGDDDGGDEEGKATVQWGRGGAGIGWEEMKKPWRLRDREQAMREERVPWMMKGLLSRAKEE